jgi:hypothetical protein
MPHWIFDILLWVFYLFGQGLHVWLRAWHVVRSAKAPEIATYRVYLRRFAPVLLARFFVATCFFMLWVVGSDYYIPNLMPQGGNPLVKIATGGLMGVAADALIDKFLSQERFSWLRSSVPPSPE